MARLPYGEMSAMTSFKEAEIERLEDLRYSAMVNKDIEALNRLLHDKLIYVHSSGDEHTKAVYLAGL